MYIKNFNKKNNKTINKNKHLFDLLLKNSTILL